MKSSREARDLLIRLWSHEERISRRDAQGAEAYLVLVCLSNLLIYRPLDASEENRYQNICYPVGGRYKPDNDAHKTAVNTARNSVDRNQENEPWD